jgi:hypothetical protein
MIKMASPCNQQGEQSQWPAMGKIKSKAGVFEMNFNVKDKQLPVRACCSSFPR